MTLPERFWSKVNKNGPVPAWKPSLGPCWVWTGAKQSNGYGHWGLNGKTPKAHRSSFEDARGPVPEGLDLDHLCRNRLCVNPSHLEPVTRKTNVTRGEGGRHLIDKTHCAQGHLYNEENTQWKERSGRPGSFYRRCRACAREYHRTGTARRVPSAR